MTTQNLPTYLRDIDIARVYSVSRTTVWRWTAEGILPEPIRLGPATTRWRLSDILDHDQQLRHDSAADDDA